MRNSLFVTSEKLLRDVLLRSVCLTDVVGKATTKNLVFPIKVKNKIPRFLSAASLWQAGVRNDKTQTVAQNFFFTILFLLFILLGCKKSDSNPVPSKEETPVDTSANISGYELVWRDEFNGTDIDASKWNYQTGGGGWGNNELQYYTNRKENSFIENGNLVIQAREESYGGRNYTSARMNTAGKGDWKYGLFAIRAKLPYGQGIWPAIWMMPTDSEYGTWPASGEIDIMEMLGHDIKKIYGTIHYAGTNNAHLQTGGSYTLSSGSFVESFHTFIVAWDSVKIQWLVDSVMYFTAMKAQPFDKRFYIILNVAVGGNWPGNPNGFTIFPQRMEVDYVRVYRKK